MVRTILAKVDFLDEAIDELSARIGELIAPFGDEVGLLCTITGVKRRTAEGLVAEIGTDMNRFPTPGHLASWAGMCPGNHESGGKRKSGKTRKGPKWLGVHLAEAAAAAGRSKGTYLGAQHRRLTGRIGYPKANKAVGHSILVAAWHVLSKGVAYEELGADWFVKRRPQAHARRLAKQIEALGFSVTIAPAQAA
jgi:transposase